MLSTDEAELVIKNCIAFNLVPEKRQTAADRNKVSKFKKLLKTSNNDSINILSSLVLELIKGNRSETEDINIIHQEEYRSIIQDVNYCNMSNEDICVSLWRQLTHHLSEKKRVLEDVHNERIEYERIIQNKSEKITESNNEINRLTSLNNNLDKKNEHLVNKLLDYDSDTSDEECALGVDYDAMNNKTLLEKTISDLKFQLEDKDFQIEKLKGMMDTNDIAHWVDCPSEEEDHAEQVNQDAKAYFAMLEKQNEAKRLANRKKFDM